MSRRYVHLLKRGDKIVVKGVVRTVYRVQRLTPYVVMLQLVKYEGHQSKFRLGKSCQMVLAEESQ